MKIEIELTEEQADQLKEVDTAKIGSEFFVIPAQIKLPNWDNSLIAPKVIGRLLTGDDANEMTRLINDFMREIKERDSDDTQKDIEV